jgi:hypothetical protein
MAKYTIVREDDGGILICRIQGFIDDQEAASLARDWRAAVLASLHVDRQLRVMFDNSGGHVMSAETAKVMAEATSDLRKPNDRRAVIACTSLAKLQAKRTMTSGGEVFISEKAARMWLCA